MFALFEFITHLLPIRFYCLCSFMSIRWVQLTSTKRFSLHDFQIYACEFLPKQTLFFRLCPQPASVQKFVFVQFIDLLYDYFIVSVSYLIDILYSALHITHIRIGNSRSLSSPLVIQRECTGRLATLRSLWLWISFWYPIYLPVVCAYKFKFNWLYWISIFLFDSILDSERISVSNR